MEFLNEFGIQPVLLAAQIVNFLIMLYLLKRFLYKPILKVLEERKKAIAQSLQNADEIESRLNKLTEEEEKRLLKSAQEGAKIIKEAQDSAVQIIDEAKVKAEDLAQDIVRKAQAQLQVEKQQLQQEVMDNLGEFIVLGLKKVTGKVLTKKDQQDLIKRSVKEIKT